MAKLSYLPPAALGLGILLLAASFVWPYWFDPKSHWSESQAGNRTEAGIQVKVLSHRLNEARTGAERQRIEARLDEAQKQFDQSGAELEHARDRYQLPITLLRWSGTLCLLLGVIGHFLLRGAGN
jgi:hypothetical protein